MRLSICVEKVEFDAEQCSLRVNGRNVTENEFVKLGQYHNMEIELAQSFTIEKDCWDHFYLELLDEVADPSKKSEVAAIVLQEGLCHVCLVTSAMTITRSRIERAMPKKKQVQCELF